MDETKIDDKKVKRKGRIAWNKGLKGKEYLKYLPGGKQWNKGLTYDTDNRVKKNMDNRVKNNPKKYEKKVHYGRDTPIIMGEDSWDEQKIIIGME